MTETITETSLRTHVAALLDRYPNLEPRETSELLDFLKFGPAVDRGMLKGDPATAPVIQRVLADHAEHFRVGLGKHLGIALAITLPFLVLCWLMWDSGAR
ncbi:hypothetical protein [Sphingomonas sp. LT1P40]|uniref:hypothetical protein n=1 Tax=Alteristakelama amylovorans TaxID=3096166 RepID=UPI002FC6AFA7